MNKHHIVSISVIIPTLNRPDSLRDTLQSFMAGSCVPSEFIIVDQSTKEQLKAETKQCTEEFVGDVHFKYIFLNQPSSTKARNAGIEKTCNEIIVFSDDDVELRKNTIENLYNIMACNGVSIIGALDDNTVYHDSWLGYISGIKSFRKRKKGNVSGSFFGRYPSVISQANVPTEWCMGYFFAVKKSLIDKWKLRFDENLTSYAYAEDLDFSYGYYKHSLREGLKCLLSDSVRVKHLVSKEYRIPSRKATNMLVLHRYYLIHKYRLGLRFIIQATYANLWITLERALKRQKPLDVLQAMFIYFIKKGTIDKGNIEKFII